MRLLLMKFFSSNLSKMLLSSLLTMSLGFSLNASADDSEQIKSSLMSRMTSATGSFISSGIGAILSPNFDTVEVKTNLKEGNSMVDIGVLKAYGENPNSFLFNQINLNRYDDRTTLNLGLGYRRLNAEETWMTGVNAFYDHEFPYDHGRYSIGLEARSTVGEINANMYQATTKWKTGKNGLQERALDGWDIEAGLPLPYMNWATVFVKRYEWSGEDGRKDIKGNDAQLRAYVPILPGLEIQAGRTFKDDDKDSNYFTAIFNVTDAFSNKPKQPIQWFNDTAYKLESMEDRRYEKVRRENIIVKQIGAGFIAKAVGV